MALTKDVVDAFQAIGVSVEELTFLAPTVNFYGEKIYEDDAILLRDVWKRCKAGEPRVEAFWPWGPDPHGILADYLF